MDTQPSQFTSSLAGEQSLQPKTNKKLITILVVIFLFLAAGTGAYWYFYQQNQNQACIAMAVSAKNPTTGECKYFSTPCDLPKGWGGCSELEIQTIDWQTYRNEEYGFEIKYPPNLIIESLDKNNIWFWQKQINDKCDEKTMECIRAIKTLELSLKIDDSTNKPLSEVYKDTNFYQKEKFMQTVDLKIDNTLALKAIYCTGEDCEKDIVNEVFVIRDEKLYTLVSGQSYFNQILSTFKFTK